MAERANKRTTSEGLREETVEEILAAARPLPLDDMVIKDLTEEEAKAFYKVIDEL